MCDTCSDEIQKVINDDLGFREEILTAEREMKESEAGVGYDEDWLHMYHRRLNSLISQASDISNPHAIGTAYSSRYEDLIKSFRDDLKTLQGMATGQDPQVEQNATATQTAAPNIDIQSIEINSGLTLKPVSFRKVELKKMETPQDIVADEAVEVEETEIDEPENYPEPDEGQEIHDFED